MFLSKSSPMFGSSSISYRGEFRSNDPISDAIELELWLATFGMLEDVLLKVGEKVGRGGGKKSSRQSPLFSTAGSIVVESIASRSFYSLPANTESTGSNTSGDIFVQQLCSSWQANEASGFSGTHLTKIAGSDSLKAVGQIHIDVRKRKKEVGIFTSGRGKFGLNHYRPLDQTKEDFFTEEMLALAPFAKVFATGPEDPLNIRFCFFLHHLQAEYFHEVDGAEWTEAI